MNQVTHECLGQNLSHFTYEWTEEPSHLPVPWSKLGGRTNQANSKCLVQNLSPSTYGWNEEPSHSRMSWSKFMSFYLRVEGRTKSLTGDLVEV